MPKISDIRSREILDSRGNPTLETTVILDDGLSATASVPSGASKGTHEALELRDFDPKRYLGMGVLKAIENTVSAVLPLLRGAEITDQNLIDKKMIEADGSESKRQLGANCTLSVSLAAARTASKALKLPLYRYLAQIFNNDFKMTYVTPLFNIINGGLHGSGKLKFQEFLLIPDKSKTFPQALMIGAEIYQRLKKELISNDYVHSVGDEGGFTPDLELDSQAIEIIIRTIESSSYSYGKDVHLGLDLASSVFYKDQLYVLTESKKMTRDQFIDFLKDLTEKYKLYSLEDALSEDDWEGWQNLTAKLGEKALIVGDDLLVTNKKRLQKAIETKACNSILVKPNQIGTLTETFETIRLARKSGFKTVLSHRSGETNDDFISDLAVAVGADFVKFGAPARGERVAKYNRLLEIYSEIPNNPIIQ